MKRHRVFFIAAIMALIVGFGLLEASKHPMSSSVNGEEKFRLPGGAEWYSFFELDLREGGSVSVEFREISDGSVNIYVFNEVDYAVFEATGFPAQSIAGTSGSSGTLAIDVSSDGLYYLVFEHGSGYETSPQDIEVRYAFAGLQPTGPDQSMARMGFILVILGAASANLGAILYFPAKRKVRRRATITLIPDSAISDEEEPLR